MTQTPNHGYNVPEKGTRDWHIPLNENFRQYDTDIEIRDTGGRKDVYDPTEGAKFLATDTGDVYIGDGDEWNRLETSGRNPSFGEVLATGLGLGQGPGRTRITARLESGDGAVIDARTSSNGDMASGLIAEAESPSGETFGVRGASRSTDGTGVLGMSLATSGGAIGVEGRANSPDGDGVLAINNEGYAFRSQGDCRVNGDLEVTGSKNFVQRVDTPAGETEVVYTAIEAGTPTTEVSGVAELTDGSVELDLPDHFAWVTDDDKPLVVQVTAHAGEKVHPQVTERSTRRIVIRDFEDRTANYEVSYTVKGTRDDGEARDVVRESSTERSRRTSRTGDDDSHR